MYAQGQNMPSEWNDGVAKRIDAVKGILRMAKPVELVKWVVEGLTARDLRAMRDGGLDTVQLWVLWGWVESVPGRFRFDDYDRLVELAGDAGLNVVLSTIAEIQPHWIHRLRAGLRIPEEGRGYLGCGERAHP